MPVWSPKGDEIAFVTWDEKDGGAIYKASLNSKNKVQKLTNENGVYSYPVWNNLDDATIKGIIYPSLDPSIFEVRFPNQDIKGKITQY